MSPGPQMVPQEERGQCERVDHQSSRFGGFSLIEIIGVLAIIGIVAAATLPVLIRQIDYASQGVETTNLAALATGLLQGSSAQRYVPGQANWSAFIATNAGWQLTAVQSNARNNQRIFLIDPNLLIGTNTAATLPYQQTSVGANSVAGARFIIVTSLSSPLPSLGSADFNNLWNNPIDTIPPGASWSGWRGLGADVRIQRVNLGASFSHLVLTVLDPTNVFYAIDNSAAGVTNGAPLDSYFLKSTVLNLYYPSTNGQILQASQVLQRDSSWFFSGGLWRNASLPAPSDGGGTLAGLQSMIQTFFSNSLASQQVYIDITNYMGLYLQYAQTGFKNNNAVQSATTVLNQDIANLVK